MAEPIRRVVTGHDKSGKAVVLSDGPVPVVHSNPLRPGQSSYEIWKTGAMPIPIAAQEPEPTGGPRKQAARSFSVQGRRAPARYSAGAASSAGFAASAFFSASK